MQDALDLLPIDLWYLVLNGAAVAGEVPFLDARFRFNARRVCRLWNAVVGSISSADAVRLARNKPAAVASEAWASGKMTCASVLVDDIVRLRPRCDHDQTVALLAQYAPPAGWPLYIPCPPKFFSAPREPVVRPRHDASSRSRTHPLKTTQHLFDCAVEAVRRDEPDIVLPLLYLASWSRAPGSQDSFCSADQSIECPRNFRAHNEAAFVLWHWTFVSGAVRVATEFMRRTTGCLNDSAIDGDPWLQLLGSIYHLWYSGWWIKSACESAAPLAVYDACSHRYCLYVNALERTAHSGNLGLFSRIAASEYMHKECVYPNSIAANAIHGRGSPVVIESILVWLVDNHGYVVQRVDGRPVAHKPRPFLDGR
ncbi:F-box incomplete domain containing protein [Pandoravirus macleodensis]|uniref:F-box incomplete domain containing protein n=1 Tax=Pandoravirus macleodensis TaxID=2107707 RepID=A0A2U7UFC1_9VIRU|nr:F-box incomplete domain containing protein [Pandoravirus macleodensis]AVK77146.1 F-box incomplete domain containing protein [Pandoravirus macleodensis]UMO79859.1 F-box incomplete domain containing protein [Pandoravirus aubagnensis]